MFTVHAHVASKTDIPEVNGGGVAVTFAADHDDPRNDAWSPAPDASASIAVNLISGDAESITVGDAWELTFRPA
jgi:hypothetical protein